MNLVRVRRMLFSTLTVLLVCGVSTAAAQVGTVRVTIVEDRTGLPVTEVQLTIENDTVAVQPFDARGVHDRRTARFPDDCRVGNRLRHREGEG